MSSFATWDKMHYQNGCTVFKVNFDVKVYPGSMCIFLDDGTFISASSNGIRRFKPDQTMLWEVPGFYHHQLNLSVDKKRILTLATDTIQREKHRERDDAFVVLDIETGRVLYRKSARDMITANKILPMRWRETPVLKESNADIETTHFNSIYEIPANSGKASYLKAGNIIVNSVGLGIFILSPDLEKTLYHNVNKFSFNHRVHDVQVTASGEFLFFNNQVDDLKESYRYSAIHKYDPVTDRLTFEYTSQPKAFFFSPVCGGVQELDDDLLFFSHVLDGGFLYSRKQKKMISAIPGTNGNIFVQTPTQQIKMIDFSKFQENSK